MAIKEYPPGDRLDGYQPRDLADTSVESDPAVKAEIAKARSIRRYENLDGFQNLLTGIGAPALDKIYGGSLQGIDFLVRLLAGTEIQNRWRGSDLGGRVVEQVPAEMLREGWEITVQPDEDEQQGKPSREDVAAAPPGDQPPPPKGKFNPVQQVQTAKTYNVALATAVGAPSILLQPDDKGSEIVEELEQQLGELEVQNAFREGLQYERAYGGGGIFLGIDDGETDLSKPLNEEKIKRIHHVNAYRGGFDGELIAWNYYNDPRKPKFGMPEVYMLRNLGVPIARPPAPGSTILEGNTIPAGPTGALIFYVHESRLLIFPGTAVSRQARVQLRGWGDSIFTRVDEVLSQFGQTWGSVSNLMTDWAQGVLKLDGLSEMLSSPDINGVPSSGSVANRMRAINMSKSIARTLIIDKEEEFTRETTPLAGIAEVLQQFAIRLAAAADMPVSLLFGQAPAGLNATGASDIRFFYDRIAAKQRTQLLPQLKRLIRLMMLAKEGPTKGKEMQRWSVDLRPLYQLTAIEEADLRLKQAQVDNIYLTQKVITPEEVAHSRFGGSKWSAETIIDYDGRQEAAKLVEGNQTAALEAAEAATRNTPPSATGPETNEETGAVVPGEGLKE